MEKTYPKKLGAASKDDIVYYLEEKFSAALDTAIDTVYPEFPETEGSYFLQLTISGSTATLSWEEVAEDTTVEGTGT